MSLLLEIIVTQGFLIDIFGVLGLGFVALAAIRLTRHWGSTGGSIMTWGAISLLAGRIGILIFSQYVTPLNQGEFDPTLLAIAKHVALALLTFGLGAIVWGFWGHERQLSAAPAAD